MTRQRGTSRRTLIANIGIILAVTLISLLLTQDIVFEFPPFKRAELSLVDLRFQRRGQRRHSSDSSAIVLVTISRESFKSLPEKWPWPKSYYARLIRNLHRAGARAIGLDVLFNGVDARDSSGESEFRRVLHETNGVVLAGTIETDQPDYLLREEREAYGNVFIDSSVRFGIVNVRTDVDGIFRRYMPFTYDAAHEKRLPAFSMAVLGAYLRHPAAATVGYERNAFRFGNHEIPRYDNTSFLINYYGPSGSFARIDIANVLDDSEFKTVEELNTPGLEINTFDDTTRSPGLAGEGDAPNGLLYNGTFAGKIVLVGSIDPEDKDLFPTPIGEGRQPGDNMMYGVEIHANVIQQILDGNYVRREPFWMTVLLVLGLSAFTFTLTAGLKAIRASYSVAIEFLGVAIVFSELVIIYWGSIQLFTHQNVLTDMMSPFTAVIVSYIASTIYNYMTERKQKVLIKGMFSRYVNPSIVDELVADPKKLRLGGERKELTVLFSDIADFTKISERVLPEYLVQILNEYLSVMTAIIFSREGTLDKYEGDAILAFWGAPIAQGDHALRACRAALDMQRSLVGLRTMWEKEGKPAFHVRVGINTGDMVVGNMGGASRFDYTVIGDSVNLGSRLEGANKQYGTGIIISEHTFRHVADAVTARELDMLVVSGRTEPIRVFELIGMKDDPPGGGEGEFLELYRNGIALYRQRAWGDAIAQFERALRLRPNDRPSELYLERLHLYRETPPPEDWNGVFVLTSK